MGGGLTTHHPNFMQKFYRIWNPKTLKFRIYSIPDLCVRLPEWFVIINNELDKTLKRIRSTYQLVWDKKIQRFHVYFFNKRFGLWGHLLTAHNPKTLESRALGNWMYVELRKGDLTKGGGTSVERGVKEHDRDVLSQLNPREKQMADRYTAIMHEINKDFEWFRRGRQSIDFSTKDKRLHKRVKPKKIVFVGARTGKVLKVMNVRR